MIDPGLAMWICVALLALVASSLSSGVEMGCYALNRVRLAVRAERREDRPARILRDELSKPDRLITTLLVTNNIFNSLAALAITKALNYFDLSALEKVVINIAILAPVLLIAGDTIPKELFRQQADRALYAFAIPLKLTRLVLSAIGIVPLVVWFNRQAERWSGLRNDTDSLLEPRQRLATLLRETQAHGVLSEAQTSLVDRVLNLRRMTVADEMVPWIRVRTIPAHWETRRASRLMAGVPHAWLPVVDGQAKVIGVVRQTDLHLRQSEPLATLIRQPARLDPTTGVYDALAKLRGAEAPVGIVESGGAIGFVSIKDLVEPLTGDLADF